MVKKLFLFSSLFSVICISFAFALDLYGPEGITRQLNELPPGLQEHLGQQNQDSDTYKVIETPQYNSSTRPYRDISPALPTNVSTEVPTLISVIEKQYRELYQTDLSKNLKQFGYDIFSTGVAKPSSLAVPDEDYIIGAGDELLIRVWGSGLDAAYPTIVDRRGVINLPKIGILKVAGLKYKDIESIIQNEVDNYIQGININVAFTRLRSLELYVVGAVRKPGLHVVPAFSTIFDGVMAAGGVLKKGTLRKIKLKRGGELIQNFDLYDLLLAGSRSSDRQLKNRDVIFVPGIGETVAIAGAVNNEAIFEIKDEKTIKDIVSMAGDVLPQAYGTRIYLRRFQNNKDFIIKDIEAKSPIEEWENISVQNGDLVDVTFSKTVPRLVYLDGHVWTRDIFQHKTGLKLSDILTTPEMLKPNAILDFALIHRYNPETTIFTPVQFPLAQVFSKKYDATVQPFDKIQILSRDETGINEMIAIEGGVWNPGRYEYGSGLTLADAIALAGGVKFGARYTNLELARKKVVNESIETEYKRLNLEINGDFKLQPFDSLHVPMLKDAVTVKKVRISGEVAYPGYYTISEGDRVSDVIKRAGGFTRHAYFYGAKFSSLDAQKIQQESIETMLEQLQVEFIQASSEVSQEALSATDAKAVEVARKQTDSLIQKLSQVESEGRIAIYLADLPTFANSSYDFVLKDGDALHIPEKPSFVSVVGTVYTPGSFLYHPNQSVDFYLQKSGGLAKGADEDYVYLIKANGEITSKGQSRGWGSNFGDIILMPGDTIVVPRDLGKVPYLKYFQSVTDIAFKIATTAGIILAI